ncbi:MAG: T9SS type A sorting domain-containing protein, partial [Sphingobacteriales bacterium]
ATGTALSYQWQVNTGSGFANVSNAAPYTGATTATLSISNAPASITGHQYRCIVSNPCTNVTSAAAAITVNTTPAVTTHPVSTSICDGTSASFAVATSGTGLTYQWQVNTGSGYSNVTDNTTYSGATTATLNIAGANTTMNGYLYRCTIANTCATQSSNAATLTIHTTLAVTASPTSQTICEGANTTFSVTNTGIGGTYQWQVNTGSGFNNISNAVPYTGATTATLAVSNVAASLNNYQYRCIITNSCGSVTSATASLTVQTLPSFTTQPVSSTICLGASTAFAVATSGTGITYQWQVNSGSGFTNIVDNAIYSGATAASLAVNSPIASMDGYLYRCVVTNTCYNVTSTSVALNINTAPAITTSPVNQTICETYNTTISVVATGSGLTYQWQVDNGSGFANVNNSGIYNGATTASLILSNIPAAINGYQYRCVINGVCTPSVTSGAATITVNYLPSVTTHPVSTTLCSGNSTNFSVLATGTNVSYQWEINTGSGWVDLANTAPYSNVTTPTLTVSNVTTGLSGYQYRCMVRGTCTPGAASNPAILTVNPMPVVLTQPTAKVICDGSNTSFNVSTSGAINYQWQVNTGSGYTNISNNSVYSGATSATLTLTGTPISAAGLYRCVIDNVNCTAQSNGVGLTVNPLPTITTHPGSRAVCAGDPTTISIVAPGGLTYIWQINTGSGFTTLSNGGIYSGATTANLTISNVSTGMSGYQYRCLIDNTVCTAQSNPATVTVNSVPAVTTHPTNKTICLNGSTSYTITGSGTGISYQWEVNNGSGWVDLLNNTFYSNVTTATLNITGATATMNGYQYRCVVRGTCTPPAISSAVSLTVNMPPVVTANPLPKVICEGNSTTFSVTATGTALNYQWEVDMTGTSVYTAVANGTNYSGATTATLSVMSAPASFNSYRYRCVVSGTCSPVAPSTAALLTVNTSPVINTQPSSYVTCKGQNAFFTLAASGTALTYQWQVNTGSGFANLSDNAIYTGSTSNMLQLTKVPLPYNAYQYRCIVTGVCPPPATSSAVSLTVHDSTYVIAQTNSDTVCEGTTQIFSVTRGGYPATTFQWEVNTGAGFVPMTDGIVYNGVTTPVLSIVNTPDFEDGNIYRCKLTGYCNYVYSQDMKLTVNMVPTITSHPADATVKDNANATFGVTSKGDNVRYRWQSAPNETDYVYINDNQNYSGTRTNVLTVKTSSIAQSGYRFRCIIEEVTDCGFAPDTSNFAILGVQDASAVNNLLADDFQVTLYPNPVKTAQIFVRFSKAPATPQMSIRIVDKLGRTVAEEKVVVDGSGDMSVNVNNLVPGVYMLMLGDEQSRSAKTLRFTKE